MPRQLLLFAMIVLQFVDHLDSANILMFPAPYSHFGVMSQIAHALSSAGHHITFISSAAKWVKKKEHFDLWTFGNENSKFEQVMEDYFRETLAGKSQFDTTSMENRKVGLNQQMQDFFESVPTFRKDALKRKFDLVIFDSFMGYTAHFIKALDLPFIVFACGAFDPLQHGQSAHAPSPLSYVPVGFTPLELTDKMTFLERLANTLTFLAAQMAMKFFYTSMNEFVKNAIPELQHLGFEDILKEADLWLANTDFTLEFPRPLTPNVVYVGGLTAKAAKPLSKDLESFVGGAGADGFIVFSLGTTSVNDLDPEVQQVFVDVFSTLKQRVIWRYSGDNLPNVTDNVKVMKWIPQNDLLGHPQARLFLNHGGMSGVMESIYHGVPMVAIPIFGDQFDVVTRIVARGLGVRVDLLNVSRESVSTALNLVLSNPRYTETTRKMSAIMKSRPDHPMTRLVYWVEYILKYGGSHLRPASYQLNTLQYFLLDVIAFILLVLVLFLWIVKIVLCCCLGCCKRKLQKQKTE